jgi:DNA-binding transcriptional ArsR family regulator
MTDVRPEWVHLSDPKVMRALAHPARLEIMEHLNTTGADVTATECAEIVGLSPSATSYHLRELAKVGMVEQAPSRGDGRERVWRSAVPSWGVDMEPDSDPERQAAEDALVEVYIDRDFARLRSWMRRARSEPRVWAEASMLSDSTLLVTPAELRTFTAAVDALIEPLKRRRRGADPPEGARPVIVHFAAFPAD